jgi:Tfp pilus assembly protein PilN
MAEPNGNGNGNGWESKLQRYVQWGVLIAGLALQAGLITARVEQVRSDVAQATTLIRDLQLEQARRTPQFEEMEKRLDRAEWALESLRLRLGMTDTRTRHR